ncbi:hypothetical protein F4802DRAFT_191320 [Xylaria palmicola]|nr:hypothetical protein F4802DRAFT_191320 [Xylaria palmicola]
MAHLPTGCFPPYRREKDPLNKIPRVLKYKDVSLEGIPPTRGRSHSAVPEVHEGNEDWKNDFIPRIEGVMSEDSSEDDIKLLLQEFEFVELDINRLARFAICKNAVAVIRYLVEERKVDLRSKDDDGKPASCYAVWDYPNDEMFRFLEAVPHLPESLDPRNSRGRGGGLCPLYFAIIFKCFGALDFILTQLIQHTLISDENIDEWPTQWNPLQGRTLVDVWFL